MNGIPPLSSRDAHASPPQRVLERLHSSAAGLDADEAARRLAAHGYNRLPAPKRQGPLLRLLRQFHNVLLYMMLFASLVTALLGFWVDSAVILLAVVVNALIGFVQEGKAANALDAIRDMLSLHALVLRDGQRQALDAERLVPGDVVLLASGDRVPADLRLFETKNFHVDESALTGESVPVEKGCVAVAIDALLGDRRCMAYSGTLVTSGQARGVVVATAGDTELGRIGTLLREVRTLATPLLRQIASFSRWLALAILLLAGATFVLGTLWQGQPMVDMFMLVVALTASAIPEGLPAIMTVILALGVQRMARRNAIVSRLPAVETLGSVTVICSDKTGTLTRNEMTVQRIVTADQVIEVSGAGYAPLGGFSHNGEGLDPAGRDDLQEIGRAALLCNEARLHQEGEAWQLEGDPTEGALLSLGLKLENTFPELLHGKEAPCSPHIWELSRFAINSGQKGSLGFSDCTLEAMRALARYSLQNDIQTLVTVTTVGVEKMMIRAGLDVSRFGPHLKIGIERAVALRIELNAKTQIALYGGVLVEQRLAVS